MNEIGFREWLVEQGYDERTVGSRVSNALRVDRFEGDLDGHFDTDECETLVARLTYSTADERLRNPPRHAIPIDGHVRNGTATLKQAVVLYVRYRQGGSRTTSSTASATMPRTTRTRSTRTAVKSAPPLDSYAQFLDYFGIERDSFYTYGLDTSIFCDLEYARQQWQDLKQRLLGNQPVAIRRYGGIGAGTHLFLGLYRHAFGNTSITVDPSGNLQPQRNMESATRHKRNVTLANYQCSHIFGRTKNALLFEAVWNICFTPKMFDPLTGHETSGPWPDEYQKRLFRFVLTRHHELITDYNDFLARHDMQSQIRAYIATLNGDTDPKLVRRFATDALNQWLPITMDSAATE